ncbi:MAG: hypothetical protein II008_03895 [Oscillospiraceae bacterium]|nr:hypothetical protein [Oscillospiraceae bacterium]
MSLQSIARYGGNGKSPYANLPRAKTEYSVQYQQLDGGLNLWDLDYRMDANQSPDMKNLFWRDGVLCCRDGQLYCDGVDTDGAANGPGTGRCAAHTKFHGSWFLHIGTKLYRSEVSAATNAAALTEVYDLGAGKTKRGTFFRYDGCLYYKTAGAYVRIKYENDAFVCEDATAGAYVPVTYINMDPVTHAGDSYQPENRLSVEKTVWYNANGGTTYQLPVLATSVTKVEVDGTVLDSGWSYNSSTGVVTFSTAPPVQSPPVNNTVRITYSLENEAAMNSVMDCRYVQTYGSGQRVVVVMAGITAQPNGYIWNGNHTVMDPTYFPMTHYNLAGDRDDAITGFGVMNGYLVIFQNEGVGKSELGVTEVDDRAYLTLDYTNINADIGCDLPWTIQLIENNLVFCNTQTGVHYIRDASAAYENNIVDISRNVRGLVGTGKGLLFDVQSSDPDLVCSLDDETRYWIVANGNAYVWDYVLSTYQKPSWFFQTNILAVDWLYDYGNVYHLNSAGRLTRMTRNFSDYGKAIHKKYRFAVQHFGSYDRLKNVPRVVFATRSDTMTEVDITWQTDHESRPDLTPIVLLHYSFVPRDLRFRFLGFNTYANIAVRRPGCFHIRSFTMVLENNTPGADMSLVSAEVFYNYQGRDR